MRTATVVFSLLLACVLVGLVSANGDDKICCHQVFTFGGNDLFWYLYVPSNVVLECHREILTEDENKSPEFTGFAFESNGCHQTVGSCTNVIGNGGSSPWCFQDDDNDDTGFGRNQHIFDFSDVVTPICGNSYAVTRTWSSLSSCSTAGIIRGEQFITVQDSTPPELRVPDSLTVNCESLPLLGTITDMNKYFGSAYSNDLCDNRPVTDTFAVDSTDPCQIIITRDFQVSDGCQTSSGSQTITVVDNSSPLIEHPPSIAYTCEQYAVSSTVIDLNARDPCDGTTPDVTFTIEVTYPGRCANEFTTERLYEAADSCGNVGRVSQLVIVEDVNPPVLQTAVDQVVSVTCEADIPAFVELSFADACGGPVSVVSSEDMVVGAEEELHAYAITRITTATDDCGNSASVEEKILVEQVTAASIDAPLSVTGGQGTPFTVTIDINSIGPCPLSGELLITFSPLDFDFTQGEGVFCSPAGSGAVGCALTNTLAVTSMPTYTFTLPASVPVAQPVSIDFLLALDGSLSNEFSSNSHTIYYPA